MLLIRTMGGPTRRGEGRKSWRNSHKHRKHRKGSMGKWVREDGKCQQRKGGKEEEGRKKGGEHCCLLYPHGFKD